MRLSPAARGLPVCLLRIVPEPVVRTDMLAGDVWQIGTRMESGAATVVIPPGCR